MKETTLSQRFAEKFSNVGWIPSEKERLLSFIQAELLLLAEEMRKEAEESPVMEDKFERGYRAGLRRAIGLLNYEIDLLN